MDVVTTQLADLQNKYEKSVSAITVENGFPTVELKVSSTAHVAAA